MTMHSYLRIDGVPGGSVDSGYEGWIECDSVSWSLRGATPAAGHSEIRFVKLEDAASPLLARLCVAETRVAAAHFDFLRVDGQGQHTKCYEISLEDVLVANVATSPRHASTITETVVLRFSNATLTDSGSCDESANGGSSPV
jgi:type VI secretion system secreted protein Hcp